MKDEFERIEARLHLVESERDELNRNLTISREQYSNLEQINASTNMVMKRLNEEKSDEVSGQHELRDKIKVLEESLAETAKQRDDVKYEADKIRMQKGEFDNQYDDLRRETLKVRNDYETSEQQIK